MNQNDTLLRFIFKETPIKGAAVRLSTAWSAMRQYQNWPESVTRLMGEMTAGSILLASSLKFEGALIMQVQGDGPVRLAIVEVRNGLLVRATVKMNEGEEVSDKMGMKELLNAHGRGRCAIMLDPVDRREGEPLYQGVVSLTGENIADALMGYMEQSEQIHTKLWLAADDDAASGLMLQQMPDFGGKDEALKNDDDGLNRIETLAATITDEELLELSPQEITHRLFWEEAPEYFTPAEPKFACTCSREKVEAMIRNLGEVEALQIIKDEGEIKVTCDFCGRTERFSAEDIVKLFDNGSSNKMN
ncbi:MAG TPA: Hsp33 family molecular chaperone HslO [Candidatus Aphodousia faecigallinarum]|uniref:Hsp33 family molecular chaperone HslO n=1 Tax=Candidatus Aphodousia faecigallinarum TaxID=2840677 RepID=A0A9D1IIR4_9BURK|nr:Hsp33 family molecular chaperone HslO [Candidatus Aphodousia faecigallinarum]